MHSGMVRRVAFIAGHFGSTVPQKVFGAKASDAKPFSLDNAAFVGGIHAGKPAAIAGVMHRLWAHCAPRGRVWFVWLIGSSRRRCQLTAGWFGRISGSDTNWWLRGWPLQVRIFQNVAGSLCNGNLSFCKAQELFKGKLGDLVIIEEGGLCFAHLLGPIYS